MFNIYIIRSSKTGKYYIGSTDNIEKRIAQHNNGKTKSLTNKGPFKLIYLEKFATRHEAYRRERQIKSYKGGEAFKKLIQ